MLGITSMFSVDYTKLCLAERTQFRIKSTVVRRETLSENRKRKKVFSPSNVWKVVSFPIKSFFLSQLFTWEMNNNNNNKNFVYRFLLIKVVFYH